MDFFSEIFNNGALGISLIACFLAQFIKIFTGKEKELSYQEYLFQEACLVPIALLLQV